MIHAINDFFCEILSHLASSYKLRLLKNTGFFIKPTHVDTIDLMQGEMLAKNVKIQKHVLKCDQSIHCLNGNKYGAVRIIHECNVCKRSLPN